MTRAELLESLAFPLPFVLVFLLPFALLPYAHDCGPAQCATEYSGRFLKLLVSLSTIQKLCCEECDVCGPRCPHVGGVLPLPLPLSSAELRSGTGPAAGLEKSAPGGVGFCSWLVFGFYVVRELPHGPLLLGSVVSVCSVVRAGNGRECGRTGHPKFSCRI